MSKSPYIVYVGTYSEGTYSPEGYKSEGIYVCHMDRETGHIETIKTYSQSVNPTYLAIDEKNGRVFANNELVNELNKKLGEKNIKVLEKSIEKM